MTAGRVAFALIFSAAAAVYLTMLFWSLPQIAAAAGGLVPFDLRPWGYDYPEALAFLRALEPEGAAFYLDTQHRLDTVYPPLMGLVLALALLWLVPGPAGAALAAVAVLAALADLAENGAVSAMLRAGPDGLTESLVNRASMFTMAKSGLSAVAMTALLAALAAAGLRRWRAGHA